MSPITMALVGVLAYKALKSFGGSQPGAVPGGGARPSSLPGSTADAGSGSLSDILGGLLGGSQPGGGGQPSSRSGASPGGLGDILGGLLGGRPTSGGGLPGDAGKVLTGGLDNLIRDLQNSGQGRAASSWIGKGPNEAIEPRDLAKALGADTINALTAQTGMSRDESLAGLSQQLPQMIDQLTPNGRLPTEQEASRWA